MDQRLYILNEMKRVAKSLAPELLRKRDFLKSSKVNAGQIRRNFESWNAALTEAGLEAAPPTRPPTLSDEELMAAVGDLWESLGRRPTEDAMNRKGKYSTQPYRTRWGTFNSAVDCYVSQRGQPTSTSSTETSTSPGTRSAPESMQQRASAGRQRPKRDTGVYGELLNFRGLRHAPLNEQGVVYLFGMVSHELGFLVEAIQTRFPDCEAIRRIEDSDPERWEKIRIEFEYRSSNFQGHGHDPELCEIIVCWIDDWQDRPQTISVLELRKAIMHLPSD